jgi:alkanesulfonate monooxygenase SsuD/methylene tetrahydromethanopterin reductase-like flavin-dependent oxidoreductase (luciferase family)
LELDTGIAVAFARNPMAVANIGWDLQACSKGRFDGGRLSFDRDSDSQTLMTPMLTTQQDVVAAMIEEVRVG